MRGIHEIEAVRLPQSTTTSTTQRRKDTVDTAKLLDEIARGNVIALIPTPRAPSDDGEPAGVVKRWYSMAEVGEMLGFGLSKVKQLVITRELRSVKVGKYRRILPEWVDEYVANRVKEVA
jgi:excisionase family DNA binding protein